MDPGAGVSIIEKSLVNSVRVERIEFRVVTATGESIDLAGRSRIHLVMGSLELQLDVIVSMELPRGLFIIGNDILDPYDFSIEYRTRSLFLRGSGMIEFEFGNRDSFHCDALSLSTGVGPDGTKERMPPDPPMVKGPGSSGTALARRTILTKGSNQAADSGREKIPARVRWHTDPSTDTLEEPRRAGDRQPGDGEVEVDIGKKTAETANVAEDCEIETRGVGRNSRHERACKMSLPMQYDEGERVGHEEIRMTPEWTPTANKADNMFTGEHILAPELFASEKRREAVVLDTVCLKPNSVTTVPIFLKTTENLDFVGTTSEKANEWLVVPKQTVQIKYGIQIQPSLLSGSQGFVNVTNLTDEGVTLVEELRIGDFINYEPEIIQINSVGITEKKGKQEFDDKYFDINPTADPKDREELIQILRENWDVFAFSNSELGCTDVVEHSIDTGEAKPVRQRLWTRYSKAENEFISQQVQEMLDCGVIVRSYSPWVCNVVLAPKPGGELRFACDFRALNKVTQFSNYPIPRIADVLDSLSGSAVFSKLDLISGYWQVKMCESDGSDLKTGFITRDGCFIYKRLPFGVKNGCQEFQCLMDKLFADMRFKIANYIDDITPHAKTGKEHNEILREVFSRLRQANLKTKIAKCSFLYSEIKYLGFIVNGEGIRPDPAKLEPIRKMPIPKTLKDLRSFLGMVTFYKKFIPYLAFMAQPLFQLLKTSKLTAWDKEQTEAFEGIKKALLSPELLVHRDESLPIELQTDACGYAVGGVLVQIHAGITASGKSKRLERPLQYASRTLTGPERKWSTPEQEALALIFCLSIFRPYLAMRKFVIRTDHLALIYLQNLKDPIKHRIGRWALKLQEFECDIIYRPGPKNVIADALSRNPWEKPLDTTEILEIPTFLLSKKFCKEMCGESQFQSLRTDKDFGIGQLGIDIAQYQQIDDFCREVLVHIDEVNGYEMRDGVLYRIGKSGRPRVVIPISLRAIVIELYHSSRFSAHLGRNKTVATLKNRFYWEGMDKDIGAYIQKCLKCRFHKLPLRKRPGLLKPISPNQGDRKLTPGMFLSADLLGPFPISLLGNRMIIVISDILTRYAIVGALKSGTAEEVAQFLVDRVLCVYGAFRILLTDNGTCFRSKLMTELAKLLNFQQKFTTPYSPEINGLTERFNKTLAAMLSPFMDQGEFTEWEKNLPSVTFAYNTSVQASIQEIPFYLTFGRDPILPMDLALNLPSSSLSADVMANRLITAFENANMRLKSAQSKQKEHFDKGRSHISHRVGDLVLYEIPTRRKGQPDKFQPKCKGPYKIIGKLSDHSYIIEDLDPSKPKREIVGVRRLIPYIRPEEVIVSESPGHGEKRDGRNSAPSVYPVDSESYASRNEKIFVPESPVEAEPEKVSGESETGGIIPNVLQQTFIIPRRSARVANKQAKQT